MNDYERVTAAAEECCKQLYSFHQNAPPNKFYSVAFDEAKLREAKEAGEEAIQPMRELFRRAAQTTVIPETGGRAMKMCGEIRQTAHGLAFAFAQSLLEALEQGTEVSFYTYRDIRNLWPLIQTERDDVASLVSEAGSAVAGRSADLDYIAVTNASAKPEPPPHSLQPFRGGEMAYFSDRVELCGVDICSGPRANSKRTVLELLSRRNVDGSFVA